MTFPEQLRELSKALNEVGERMPTIFGAEACRIRSLVAARAADHHEALVALAEQYLSDMRHPPAEDSRGRRIKWIEETLAKVKA